MRVRASGFTLIELMIVVAAIAILAAIALPSFNEQVRKSRRSTAVANIASRQLELEKWRADHPTYVGSAVPASDSSTNLSYVIALTPSATGYTITATPQGGQTGDRCGVLTATAGTKPVWATASCNN
jgi:type IV pilus assembly protein PilE